VGKIAGSARKAGLGVSAILPTRMSAMRWNLRLQKFNLGPAPHRAKTRGQNRRSGSFAASPSKRFCPPYEILDFIN
jgi:hypothetical protein